MLSEKPGEKHAKFRDLDPLPFPAPVEDVERVMAEVVRITPLSMGAYDSNAYQTATRIERYPSLEGTAAGPEPMVRKRPGTIAASVELPQRQHIVERVTKTIFQGHSYQEPVVKLQAVLSNCSKGLDDSANPNQWWNTTGHSKKGEEQPVITECSE